MNSARNDKNGVCCFNKLVDCSDNKCRCCGWNPAVAADRIDDWKMERRLSEQK